MTETAVLPTSDPMSLAPAVEIVVPVHDEERGLDTSIRTLAAYLTDHFTVPWAITVVDNASTDATWAISQRLADTVDGVRCLHLDEKGRGARCAPRGAPATRASSRTWMSTSRPTSTRCSRSSRPC